MHNTLRSILGILIIVSGLSLAGCGQRNDAALPAVGDAAPEFALKNQDGKVVSLKDYRGQWVVLCFYPKDFDQRTTDGLHTFRRDQRKLEEMHTVVLALSGDDVSSHKAYVDQAQLQLTLLSDEGRQVLHQYGAFQRTHSMTTIIVYSTFIVDPTGKIARVFVDFNVADPSSHIVKALDTLQHR